MAPKILAFAILLAVVSGSVAQTPSQVDSAKGTPGKAQEEEAQDPNVRVAAEGWLAIADAGDFSQSWNRLSRSATASMDAAKWQEGIAEARKQFGAPKAREFKDMRLFLQKDTGEKQDFYIVIFNSVSIETGPLRELVTMVKDADGVWRASGYSIEPRRAGMDESD